MEAHPYRQAFEARDLDRLLSLLADDVILHSGPTTSHFEGRDAAGAVLGIVIETFEDVEYTHDLGDEHSHLLVFDARVLDKPIKSTWLLELDGEGKIREIWVMNRPLAGLTALAEAIGQGVERAGGGSRVREVSERIGALVAELDREAARLAGDLNSTPSR